MGKAIQLVWGYVALAWAIAAALVFAVRQGATADLEKEVVIVATGGAFEQALKEQFYEPFSRATGVTVRTVAASVHDQWAKVRAMSATGAVEWDVVSTYAEDMIGQRELHRDLDDCREIPNVATQGVTGTCQRYGVLRTIGGGVIAYNATRAATGRRPRNWADFWDVERFPGPRGMLNAGTPWWVLSAALMADGVAPDRLYPLDLDRAFRKLDQIKPHVKVWWKTGDQSQQIMRDGEVVMAMMWSGRALALKNAGVPIEVEWNQAIKDVALWGVLKDAPHPKAAMAFLDFFMDRPEAHIAFSRRIVYDTSNRNAIELLPEAERRTRAIFEPNWKSMADTDNRWVAENRARLLERWNAWLAR